MHHHSPYENRPSRPKTAQQYFSMAPYRSRKGIFLGVCQGIADHFDLSVFWTRIILVCAAPFTGFWPVIAGYILAAFLMKPEPVIPLESEEEAEFYNSYASSRSMALHRLKRVYDNLDRRIQRMESIVTDKEFEWDQRLNEQ